MEMVVRRTAVINLPFALRRGRVPSTQGMHEIQRNNPLPQQTILPNHSHPSSISCTPLRFAALNASPFAERRGGWRCLR